MLGATEGPRMRDIARQVARTEPVRAAQIAVGIVVIATHFGFDLDREELLAVFVTLQAVLALALPEAVYSPDTHERETAAAFHEGLEQGHLSARQDRRINP